MKKKVTVRGRDRAPDQKSFSVALHMALVAELENIASTEDRARNNMIFRMLKEKVADYYKDHPEIQPLDENWLDQIENRKQ